MIKNYIWDFDGMLFDSYPHITASFCQAMADYGITVDPDQAQPLFEISFGEAFDFYTPTDEQKALFRKYEHTFDFEPIAVPFKNTVETLKKVKEKGGNNYLYTHRGESAFYYLKKYGVYDLFTDFVTSENGFPQKPAPDAVEYIVKKNNLNKAETVMIGDREIDVMSGKNAGVFGCLYSENSEQETNADFRVTDISEVLSI